MIRITTEYKNFQHDIAITARRVIEKMQDNEAFTDPPPALAELKKLVPEFQQSLVNARSRDVLMVAMKNDLKSAVLALLQDLVDYVTMVSKGDRTIMLSSGFDVTETGTGNKRPPSIGKLEVDIVVPGVATIRVKKVISTIAFIHQYTTEPPGAQSVWVSEGTSLGTYTFKNLESDKRYWFRVIALGYYGLRGYSPVVTWVIQ